MARVTSLHFTTAAAVSASDLQLIQQLADQPRTPAARRQLVDACDQLLRPVEVASLSLSFAQTTILQELAEPDDAAARAVRKGLGQDSLWQQNQLFIQDHWPTTALTGLLAAGLAVEVVASFGKVIRCTHRGAFVMALLRQRCEEEAATACTETPEATRHSIPA